MRGNSKYISGLATLLLIGLLVTSCLTPPEFPVIPFIEYDNVTFQKGVDITASDTLIVSIKFQDGNGDLGLDPNFDTGDPYHSLWFYVKPNGELLKLSDRQTEPYDTLPPYTFPYYCTNYVIEESDTFYVQPNRFRHNYFVKYFVKKNGVYSEFDWLTEFDPICGESFNGRYPLLGNPNRDKPLEGTLRYKMTSAGFELLFRQDTLKLEIYILDRALNQSNTIETPDFVLKNITLGG
jgi:hypothetical protein